MVLGVTACGLVCRLREQQERAARLQKAVLAAEQQLHRETEKKQVSPSSGRWVEPHGPEFRVRCCWEQPSCSCSLSQQQCWRRDRQHMLNRFLAFPPLCASLGIKQELIPDFSEATSRF